MIKLTDVMGWSGGPSSPQAGYAAVPQVTDQVDNIRVSARRNLNMGHLNSVELGLNIADRTKVRTTQEGRLMIAGGNPYGVADVPGSSVSVAGTTGIPVVSWDPRGSLGTIYELARKVDSDILNKDWSVKEKVTTSYVKGDLDGNLFGMPYRGNVGAQIVQTRQNSTGFNVDRATCVGNTAATCPGATVGAGRSFTDFNPSLNLNFDAGNDQVVRLGVAKVLARPNMGDMRASVGFSYDNSKQMYTGDGGNPDLEPFRAKSFDLSYEKYFGKKGYVSIAGFYKDLDTYIIRSATPFDFKPFASPALPYATQGMMTRPVNGSGGTAGWMTATALATVLRGRYPIRLIESEDIGIVGVGEATIPMIQRYNKIIGLDEAEFVRETQGSFKLGIEFVNWGRLGERYMHGFGPIGQDLWTVRFDQYWHKMRKLGKAAPLEAYSITRMASKANRFMPPDTSVSNSPLNYIAYAYHFDAGMYARYLRKLAEGRGVQRTEGKITRVEQREP
ncbi:MAG: TonB-dependent receptor domain-containing protein, partial [Limnohabitans sp.]